MTTRSQEQHEALRQRALALSGQAFVHIRALSRRNYERKAQVAELKLIEALADGAHNLPTLVAKLGDNQWATEETLSEECGMCEDAIKRAALILEAAAFKT